MKGARQDIGGLGNIMFKQAFLLAQMRDGNIPDIYLQDEKYFSKYKEEIKSELGDLLYSIITIANSFDVNLEEALKMVLEKYKKRLKKGSAGSEND